MQALVWLLILASLARIVASLGFGLFLAYQIAVVDGLITGYPDAMPGQ